MGPVAEDQKRQKDKDKDIAVKGHALSWQEIGDREAWTGPCQGRGNREILPQGTRTAWAVDQEVGFLYTRQAEKSRKPQQGGTGPGLQPRLQRRRAGISAGRLRQTPWV